VERSPLGKRSVHLVALRIVERGERLETEQRRRIAELDLPGLGLGAELLSRTQGSSSLGRYELGRPDGRVVFGDEREPEQPGSHERRHTRRVVAVLLEDNLRKSLTQAIGIEHRIDPAQSDVERQRLTLVAIADREASVLELFSPFAVIG